MAKKGKGQLPSPRWEYDFQQYLNELVPIPPSIACFPFSRLLQEGDPDTYEEEFEAWLSERGFEGVKGKAWVMLGVIPQKGDRDMAYKTEHYLSEAQDSLTTATNWASRDLEGQYHYKPEMQDEQHRHHIIKAAIREAIADLQRANETLLA